MITLNGTTGITTPDIISTTSTLGSLTQALDLGSTGQIVFPATQNASANANTLDDYEEGTWTPTIIASSGGAPGTQSNSGVYRKIGSMVTIWARINFSRGTLSGVLYIDSLPFVATTFADYGVATAVNATWSWNTDNPRTARTINNAARLELWDSGTNGIIESEANTSLGNNMLFTLSYFTA